MTSCPRRCCLEEAPLAAPLHLLRGMPAAINGRSVDFLAFRRLVNQWAREHGVVFGSWTRRAPRRASELAGGSVYFVVKGATLFRMPFDGLEPVRDGFPDAPARFLDHTAIICAPRVVMVEAYKVRRLCGWRYLDDADAPPDLGPRARRRPATACDGPRTPRAWPRLSAPLIRFAQHPPPASPAPHSPPPTPRIAAMTLPTIHPSPTVQSHLKPQRVGTPASTAHDPRGNTGYPDGDASLARSRTAGDAESSLTEAGAASTDTRTRHRRAAVAPCTRRAACSAAFLLRPQHLECPTAHNRRNDLNY